MLHLDKGMLEHYAGLYEASSRDLQAGERLIGEAFTKSVTLEIASYLDNDNTKEYAGEDYEDVYLNIFNALNYYHQGSLDDALVEVRRINEKLRYLQLKYGDDIARVDALVKEGGAKATLDTGPVRFSDSALARYLGALFYRGGGHGDDARIDLDALAGAFAASPSVYQNRVPASIAEEYSVPAGKARLNVIGFTGLSPVKVESGTEVPLPFPWPNDSALLGLPALRNRPVAATRVELIVDGAATRLELLEDIGAVINETFKARQALVYKKTLVRALAKAYTAAGVATAVGVVSSNDTWRNLSGYIGRVWSEDTEQADIRMARYFPRYAYVGGINLAPGEHRVRVNFYSEGKIIGSYEDTVTVKAQTLNLVEAFCLR
jgi:hypothetical protein